MDILRLFIGLILFVPIVLSTRLVVHTDTWRSAVSALQLRWDREQRQASVNGVTLEQRQAVQQKFEQLVTNRPFRLMWLHVGLGLGAVAFALVLAWNQGDLRWTGLWLALPLGLATLSILGFGWALVNQANGKLTAISSSLYGPAPPRVKVRAIQTDETSQ